ncbi:MAG: universal stress protein, partial [Chloroflexota bacterium]|nr:universal stress protein [Chloroflexota bacterium]
MAKTCALVVGTAREEIEALLPLAQRIVSAPEGGILALGLVGVSADQSLSTGALNARRLREAVEPRARRVGAKVIVRVAHDCWREVEKTIADEKCTLVLLDWNTAPPEDWLRALPCNLAMVKPTLPLADIHRVLLPIRGGPYAALALRIALDIAESQHGEITVLHAVPPTLRDGEYQELLKHLSELPQVTNW